MVIARIVDHSGYPLIRHRDWVLLEPLQISCSEDLEALRGELVSVVASRDGDRKAYLKRVGMPVSGELRIFDSVGTFGDAIAITCAAQASPHILQLTDAWRVRGVLRGISD